MNRKKIILIVSLILFIMLISGLSYAYLRTSSSQSGTNIVTTLTCLDVTISDTVVGETGLTLTGKYPIPDSEGLAGTPYKFTITNNCTGAVSVDINLDTLSTSTLEKQYVKFNISGETNTTNLVSAGATATSTLSGVASSNKLTSTMLSANQSKNFQLRLWLDENATYDQAAGKSYYSKVEIVASALVERPFIEMFDLASAATATPLTTPGVQAATTDEGLLPTPDDYGTSYYYRGAVENNYVVFVDMCWRIVRIDGNGNIKLVLYNYKKTADRTGTNASNPCHANHDATDAAFARYDDTTNGSAGKSAFNTIWNQNAYVGLKYGTPGSSTYEGEHNGNNKSTILTNLESWYAANLNSVDSKIATVAYCNDKRTVTDTTYDPWSITPTGLGYGNKKTYYQAMQRLNPANTAVPVLTCPEGISRVESKIGLLSADEVAYAGAMYNTSNSSYYLRKNASSTYWWTSSPSAFDGYNAGAWHVYSDGALNVNVDVRNVGGLRPVVFLLPTVSVTSESATNIGTASNPYLVQ